MFIRRIVATVTGALFALALLAQTLPKNITKGASVEGITEYRLDNGLRVLLFPDPSKDQVTVNVTYLVGSRHEGQGETGMAHLLEHMVFKPTKNRSDLIGELKQHGASFNGSTAFDRTNYFETMPATEENLKWAIDMESDRMVNALIRKSDLDSEMTVVRNEFEMGENSPRNVLTGRTLHTAYLWHGYGRLPIGARSDIEKVPIERLQAYYRRYYQPDNAVLVVAGKFDEGKTINWISSAFGAIPKPTRELMPTYTVEPTQDGERTVTLNRAGDIQALTAVYHLPAGTHPDYAPLQVLCAVLGETPSGRLYKALVENKKATAAGGGSEQLREPGFALFSATLRKEQSLDEARKIMLETLDAVAKEPPTKDEVDRAKNRLIRQSELSMNDSQRIAIELSEWASMADWRMLFIDRDRLKAVTPEEVARVAKIYLVPSNRTVGEFIPTDKPVRAEIPPTPDVTSLVSSYKGTEKLAQGEVFDPSYANIEARTERSTLPAGMKLSLLSKKNRGEAVNAVIHLQFGDAASLRNRTAIATLTGGLLMRGTSKKTRQQIQDEMDKLKAQINVSGGVDSATATIQTTRPNLPAALRLAAEILRDPALPEAEFDKLKQQQLAGLEAGRNEPQVQAIQALNRALSHYPKGDPRNTATTAEQIEELNAATYDQVKKFYQQFYGASNAQMAVVGDFDAPAIKSLAAELFGNWKSPAPYARLERDYQAVTARNEIIETPDKANALFGAAQSASLRDDDPDSPAMILASYIFGSATDSRLFKRIREKDGLSYGVQAVFQSPPLQQESRFLAVAICAPQNSAKVENAFKEEIARVVKDGFTPEEIEKYRQGWLQQQQIARARDSGLAQHLASLDRYGRTNAFDAKEEEAIKKLTAEQVSAAFRKYVKPDGFYMVKAGDLKKAGIEK